MLFEQFNQSDGGLFGLDFRSIEHQFRLERRFVRIVDSGEALELAGAGLLVEALRIALLADVDRRVAEDLDEVPSPASPGPRRGPRGRG